MMLLLFINFFTVSIGHSAISSQRGKLRTWKMAYPISFNLLWIAFVHDAKHKMSSAVSILMSTSSPLIPPSPQTRTVAGI